MGIIVFYEGNNGTQNIVQTVEDVPGQNFQPVKNDEIRSCKLYGVRAGCEIRIFNSPDASLSNVITFVNVIRTPPECTVNLFGPSYHDEYVVVTFLPGKGTDGKVLCIKID